jgi:hypothetical protein
MLLIFILLMVVNYAADREKFFLAYRIDVFGMPINVLDALVAVGTVLAVFSFGKREYATERTHPGLKWTVGLLVVATFGGAGMALVTGCEPREIALMGRNVLNLAFAILIGYCAVSNLGGAKRAGYWFVISSFLSACSALYFMRESAELLSSTSSATFQELRTINMGGDLGVVCASFLAFAMVSGLRYLPWAIGLGAFFISAVGSFSLPHRSAYVAGGLTLAYALVALPPVPLGRRAKVTFALGLALLASLLLATALYSRMTGRDFQGYVTKRLVSILPSSEVRKENHAWDTRLPGIQVELSMWLGSPILGRGFGSQDVLGKNTIGAGSFRHNVWTSSLAEGGLPLFVGYALPCVLCVVVGRRLVRDRFDKVTVMIGAIAALHGVLTILYASTTMSINMQRPAISLGLICGLLLRTREIQHAVVREYVGYLPDLVDEADGAGAWAGDAVPGALPLAHGGYS